MAWVITRNCAHWNHGTKEALNIGVQVSILSLIPENESWLPCATREMIKVLVYAAYHAVFLISHITQVAHTKCVIDLFKPSNFGCFSISPFLPFNNSRYVIGLGKNFTLSVLGVKLLDLSSLRLGVSHYATQHPQLFYTPSNNIHRLYKMWCLICVLFPYKD